MASETSSFLPINRRHEVCMVSLYVRKRTTTLDRCPIRHERRLAWRTVEIEYPVCTKYMEGAQSKSIPTETRRGCATHTCMPLRSSRSYQASRCSGGT